MKSKKTSCLVLGILVLAVFCIPTYEDVDAYVWNAAGRPVVVVDAGHGGVDGGAESVDGTIERDVNLKIAQRLQKRLEDKGVRVIMTRSDAEGLYGGKTEGAIRSLKTRDMYERKAIIDKAGADLVVSIHLNSFTQDRSVKGAQVFYPAEGPGSLITQSRQAAEMIQKNLNHTINIDKPRTALGKNDVFLLRDVVSPIVIVECGFLSNDEDAANLKKQQHQEKIAKSLETSICKYLKRNGNKIQ